MNLHQKNLDSAKKNIKKYNLENVFDKSWLKSILNVNENDKKHPMFWVLSNEDLCSKLSSNLNSLILKCEKHKRIIKKLKSSKETNDLYPTITEIEVLSYFYQHFDSENIEYEPEVEIDGNKKKPDMKLIIDDENYYVEILTIFKDKKEKELDDLLDEIRIKIEDLKQPYAIDLFFKRQITKTDVDELVSYTKTLLKNEELMHKTFKFKSKKEIIAEIHFRDSPDSEGYVGTVVKPGGIRFEIDAMRAKNKFLKKIEEKQLPRNTKNILITNIIQGWVDLHDIRDAFLGQLVLTKKNEKRSYPSRVTNGIIHDERGKLIGLLIAYEYDFDKREFYFNPYAKNPIDEKIAEIL